MTHAIASADAMDYSGIATREASTVTITENDSKGVTISRTAVSVNEGGNAVEGYSVVLDSEPNDEDVTVTISGQATTDLVVIPSVLVFTVDDWDQSQMVRFTANSDPDTTDDTVTLMHAIIRRRLRTTSQSLRQKTSRSRSSTTTGATKASRSA